MAERAQAAAGDALLEHAFVHQQLAARADRALAAAVDPAVAWGAGLPRILGALGILFAGDARQLGGTLHVGGGGGDVAGLPGVGALALEETDLILRREFEKANGAMREVIIFGAMMLKIREVVCDSARGAAKGNAERKDTGLKAWIKEFAPKVSESTAYRFKALAEGVRDEFKLGKKADLTLLLTAPDQELSAKMRAQQRKIFDLIEGKSQRQLLLELGGTTQRGGKRKKVTPEETPEERHARELAALREKFELRVFGIECLLVARNVTPSQLSPAYKAWVASHQEDK